MYVSQKSVVVRKTKRTLQIIRNERQEKTTRHNYIILYIYSFEYRMNTSNVEKYSERSKKWLSIKWIEYFL